ncbi:type IV pilus secretin PilQ [Rickettsiales bacterium]|nr:type IV pilus secretin PilQ [Rickettsiales bacterium]
MKVIKLTILIALLTLNGCMTHTDKEKAIDRADIISPEGLLDKEKFIKKTKKKTQDDIKYGPKIDTEQNNKIREGYNVKIDTDEPVDYVSYFDDGTGKIFPMDINIENISVDSFAKMMSHMTGVNFLVSDEVGGYVTAKLSDVLWTSVLDSVLRMKSLAKHVDKKANIISLHSQATVVSLENFERQRREDLQKAILLEQAAEPLYTEVFKLFYTTPDDVKTMLEGVYNSAAGADSGGGTSVRSTVPQITVDARTNLLIIKARRDDLEIAKKIIEQVDSRTKQVFIESYIVEVTDDFEESLGTRIGLDASGTLNVRDHTRVNARLTGAGGSASSDVVAGGNAASLTDFAVGGATSGISFLTGFGNAADLKFELTAMEKEGLTRILSNPKIYTLDNQEATIFQGNEVPYATTSDSGTKIEFREAGLKLVVKPTIIGDGNLILNVTVNKDSVDTSVSNPPITKSEIKTTLVSKDGAIVVIGGIYTETVTDSVDRVPLLGEMPVAGKLFRRTTDRDNKKELMIFIAPQTL